MDRPLPVLVFGIFNAAYGIVCLCTYFVSSIIWIMSMFVEAPVSNVAAPEDVFETTAADWIYFIISTPVSIGLSIMLVTSGSGLIGGKQWAWSVSLLYAKLGAIYVAFTSLYWTGYMWTNWDDFVHLMTSAAGPAPPPQMFDMMWEWFIRMMIIVTLVQLLHCALLHLYMKTDRVVEWFEAAEWDGDDGLGEEDV